MKKTLSLSLAIVVLFALCLPCANAAGGFLNLPWLSTQSYTPAPGNCLYIFAPLTGKGLTCTVEIFDAEGILVYRAERSGLSTNVQTFFWDARPAAGNAGGYDPAAFTPAGNYTVSVSVSGSGVNDSYASALRINEPGSLIDNEPGIPNYTGNAQCDYLAGVILQEIGVDGLTNDEKYRAIYDWVQGTLYRENSVYARPLDETGYYYDLDALASQVRIYGDAADSLHQQGLINYDVHGDLETKRALRMMLERVGTCYEFSAILQILLEHVGIECHVYGGYFHNSDGSTLVHKWNLLRLDGTYYWSDVRIDNASYEHSERTKLYYDYYLEEDTSVWKKRHSWDESVFPVLSTATEPLDGNAVTATPPAPAEPAPGVPIVPSSPENKGLFGVDYMSAPYPLSSFADMKNRKTKTTGASLRVGEIEYQLEAYNIDGYNYFKLRDVACILSGTNAQFEVSWGESVNTIFLLPGWSYTVAGGELVGKSLVDPVASPTDSQIMFWGDRVSLSAYFINDNNYFRLRDLAILMNFGVGWDEASNTITLLPDAYYTE